MGASFKGRVLCLLALCFVSESFAAKKDFKGLFGSYRREKFTENEGNQNDWGMDIMLSTALPLSALANSTETRGEAGNPMAFSTFFNAEGSVFYTFGYHWEVFLNVGYYSYETRQLNSTSSGDASNPTGDTPLYHTFNIDAIPVTLGVKYRFSRSDIVPYVGLGVGAAYVHRHAGYDYSDLANDKYSTVPAGQATLGVEFFISPRAGIRLETSAMFWALSDGQLDSNTNPGNFPIVLYQSNPIAVRYASGLFLLF